MQIAIVTTGSRGDVQPIIALARGCVRAGHRVRVATHSDFANFFPGTGIDFSPLILSARALHEADEAEGMMATGNNPFAFIRYFARLRSGLAEELMEQCWSACRGADLIIASLTAISEGQAAAEKECKPLCLAYLQPSTPSWHLPHCLLPEKWRLPLGGLENYLSHAVLGSYFWLCNAEPINRARQTVLALPPLNLFGTPWRLLHEAPVLYGFSERVVPRPPDWGKQHRITGYWFLDRAEEWTPPAALKAFLDAGPPPLMIGFGSMHATDAGTMTRSVLDALRSTRQRAVLLTGWGGLAELPRSDQWFVAEAAPHDWLLPRVRAAIHHGGAGTTAACLRAGKPALVVPFMADQFFWGRRVHALGAGPRPVPRRRLTAERLSAAIEQLEGDPDMERRAADFGRQLRREDGVARAAEAIDELFTATAPAPKEPQLLPSQ